MKVDSSSSAPIPHYHDIFHDYVIPIESCEGLPSSDIMASYHYQNSWNVSFTSKRGEEKYSLLAFSNLPSHYSEEIEGEIFGFQSSTL